MAMIVREDMNTARQGKLFNSLQVTRVCWYKGQCCHNASTAVKGSVRAARRSEKARLSIKMFLALYMSLFHVTKMINIRFRNTCFMRARS